MAARSFGSMFGRMLLLIVLATLALAGYTLYQAVHVRNGLERAAGELQPAVQDLQSGDVAAARRRLDTVQEGAAEAADNSNGPGWWIASRAPVVGDDVEAVRTVADVSDVLASGVLPDVISATEKVTKVDPYDGRAAVAQLKRAAASLDKADTELRRQEARVAAIQVDELDSRLADPVSQMQVALAGASDFLGRTSRDAQQALDAVPSLP